MTTPPVLRGYRRELTKELFEDLGALQCEPAEILGGQPGGVKGVAQLRADIQVDHLVSLLDQGGEEIQHFLDPGGGGLGEGAVLAVADVHILRGIASIVQESVVSQGDGQG